MNPFLLSISVQQAAFYLDMWIYHLGLPLKAIPKVLPTLEVSKKGVQEVMSFWDRVLNSLGVYERYDSLL